MDKFAYQKALHGQQAFAGHTAARVVLQIIIDHADAHLGNAWPSVRTIAKAACLSASTVQLAITYLQQEGFLVIEQPGGRKASNRYRLTLPPVPTIGTPCVPTTGTHPVPIIGTGCADQRHGAVPTIGTEQGNEQIHSKPTASEREEQPWEL